MKRKNLYNLCRKYKYYYKAYQDLKKIDKTYWNKNLKKTIEETEKKMKNIENEITLIILENIGFFDNIGFDITNNIDPVIVLGQVIGYSRGGEKEVVIHSDRFAQNISDLFYQYEKRKDF